MDRVINVARDPVNVGRPAESGIGNEVPVNDTPGKKVVKETGHWVVEDGETKNRVMEDKVEA